MACLIFDLGRVVSVSDGILVMFGLDGISKQPAGDAAYRAVTSFERLSSLVALVFGCSRPVCIFLCFLSAQLGAAFIVVIGDAAKIVVVTYAVLFVCAGRRRTLFVFGLLACRVLAATSKLPFASLVILWRHVFQRG